jgi:hypothetical protein
LKEALAAAEKAGAAIFGDIGKKLGREAGEKAARAIAAKLGRELGAEAGDAAGLVAGGVAAVQVIVYFLCVLFCLKDVYNFGVTYLHSRDLRYNFFKSNLGYGAFACQTSSFGYFKIHVLNIS